MYIENKINEFWNEVNDEDGTRTFQRDFECLRSEYSWNRNEDILTRVFLYFLGRGGNYQFYQKDTETIWFDIKEPVNVPFCQHGTYFNINPCKKIIHNKDKGGIENIAAINCLFSEFGGKYGTHKEEVINLVPTPSIIVEFSRCWQCYWLLKEPVIVTQGNIQELIDVQKQWVDYTGGFESTNDLTAVMNVPVSFYSDWDGAGPSIFVRENFNRQYLYKDLTGYLGK